MKKLVFLSMLICLCIGCVGPGTRIPEDEKKPLPESASPADVPSKRVLFYVVHAESDGQKLAELLEKSPALKLTLIFPPRYFSSEEPQPSQPRFKILQSSGQIEIALALDNQPVLPLLADLSAAGKGVSNWNIDFSWPADVGGQLALGSGTHQKRWGVLPSGFYPPYFTLAPNVAGVIKQFRFDWVLTQPGDRGGASYSGSTAFISPVKTEASDTSELVKQVLQTKIAFVDSSAWENPARETEFLSLLAAKGAASSPPVTWLTAKEWVSSIDGSDLLPPSVQIYEKDYSKWFASERQRLAWIALAEAREVIETYKNSGRANLKRLDAALEEMYSAESGDFLLALGQNKFISVISERSFLATLANVYRLCGVAVPAGLNAWFTNARWKKTDATVSNNDRPFYAYKTDRMTWNDPAGDEGGDRKLVYPVGKYPSGAFDLRAFDVAWDDANVTFSAVLGGMVDPRAHVVLPLVDVYVDVNKLSGAGSQDVIPGRRGGSIGRDAAWEYALSFSPIGAALYQSVPGGPPRMMQPAAVSMEKENRLVVSLPRTALRGAPKQWRLTVALSGTESRKVGDFAPVAVLQNAGERNFGGGADRPSACYVDLLAEQAAEQKFLLSGSGSDRLVLPSVEAQ